MSLRQYLPILFACSVHSMACATEMTSEQRAFFENKIRPVLVKQCYECHSADAKKLGGKLLLDAPSEMIAGGESGPSLIPGRPDESLIILDHPPRRPPSKPNFKHATDAPLAMGVRDAKTIIDCKLNIDGESKKLGPAVPRGFLSVCGDATLKPDAKQSGRLQLAQWLTSPQHPLTARVMVNRVWQHLFGEGLVRTPDDFGAYGGQPTHPELLDHLATRFMRDGWSIKRLIRSIVLSHTYQLSSTCDDALRQADPENTLLTRHNRRRLDAEAARDAMLVAAGNLNPQPAQGSLIQHRDVLINELPPLHQPSTHRSIYLLMLRNSMPPELTPFNLPDATTVTGRRDDATLATQSLYLLNNDFLVSQSRSFAGRVQKADADDVRRIQFAYRQAFGRAASDAEAQRAHDFIHESSLMLASSQGYEMNRPGDAWAAFCQALLASNELRFVD